MARDPRIDDKIAKSAPFAQPILTHLRELVHVTVPDVDEAIKWGMPHFMYRGKNVAGMAGFKAHCAFMIHGDGRQGETEGMGSLGKLASLDDLPSDQELAAKLREAMARIDSAGTAMKRSPEPKQTKRQEIAVPDDLIAALEENPEAQAAFDAFAPSHRWEYLDWIASAKRPETRAKRIGEAIGMLAEGKHRNWKYER